MSRSLSHCPHQPAALSGHELQPQLQRVTVQPTSTGCPAIWGPGGCSSLIACPAQDLARLIPACPETASQAWVGPPGAVTFPRTPAHNHNSGGHHTVPDGPQLPFPSLSLALPTPGGRTHRPRRKKCILEAARHAGTCSSWPDLGRDCLSGPFSLRRQS